MGEEISKKIVLVGDHCGKTCLRYRFWFHRFPEYISELQGESRMEVDQKQFLLTLVDTTSSADYDRLRPLVYYDADAFMVCFSLENQTSFKNVKIKWIPEIQKHRPGVPFIIVGTKSDLWLVPATDADEDALGSLSEGQKLAAKMGAYSYKECSAKRGDGVREAFEAAVRASLVGKKKKRFRDSCNLF